MPPIKSNINKETCSPISSNCIVWQGPDLKCISVCTGQTLSESMYALANKVCELQALLDLSDLDLKCLIDKCLACPEPDKKLAIVLQLLIDKVCTLQEIIDNLDPSDDTNQMITRMAVCFQFTDSSGDLIKDLPLQEYVKKIGIEVCNLATQITALQQEDVNLQNQIDNLDTRVTVLENATLPQVTLTCINPGLQDMDEAIEAIEANYCAFKGLIGPNPDIADIVAAEPTTLPQYSLTNPSAILWATASTNAAQSIEKMWLAITDLRSAVKLIQDNCCKITCDDIIIDFDVKLNITDNEMTLFFLPKSNLPTGWYDCNTVNGTKFNITDGAGHQSYFYIKLREDVFDDNTVLQNGYLLSIPGAIDPTQGMTITSDVCLTDGSSTCVKCVTVQVNPSGCDYCKICATGAAGSTAVIIYDSGVISVPGAAATTTTTSSPVTTTTTAAVTTTTTIISS